MRRRKSKSVALKPSESGGQGVARTMTLPRPGEEIVIKMTVSEKKPFKLVIQDPEGLIDGVEFDRSPRPVQSTPAARKSSR